MRTVIPNAHGAALRRARPPIARTLARRLGVLAATAVLAGASGIASAAGLPKTFAWTAYGTTSAGYAVSVAIGNAIAEEGYKLRVLPAKNDISRMTPLKARRVQFSAMGIGSYQAQEGVLDFGKKGWGPQPLRLVMASWSDVGVGIPATAKDANIITASDMKGKRIAWVVGGPALNQNMTAWLAFGDLTWDDVVRIEVPGWKASIQGMIDGNIDAAIASTNSSMLFQLASSPRGLRFFPAPHADKAAWARLHRHAPWFVPIKATSGVGLSKDNPLETGSYGYPILVTYDWLDAQAANDLVRLLHTKFDKYKDAHSSAPGFAMERQVFDWIIPYHEGAIAYFKKIGVWKPEHDAHNQKLLERQKVLQQTWKKAVVEGGADYAGWMKARAAALEAAGFDPVWRE